MTFALTSQPHSCVTKANCVIIFEGPTLHLCYSNYFFASLICARKPGWQSCVFVHFCFVFVFVAFYISLPRWAAHPRVLGQLLQERRAGKPLVRFDWQPYRFWKIEDRFCNLGNDYDGDENWGCEGWNGARKKKLWFPCQLFSLWNRYFYHIENQDIC